MLSLLNYEDSTFSLTRVDWADARTRHICSDISFQFLLVIEASIFLVHTRNSAS